MGLVLNRRTTIPIPAMRTKIGVMKRINFPIMMLNSLLRFGLEFPSFSLAMPGPSQGFEKIVSIGQFRSLRADDLTLDFLHALKRLQDRQITAQPVQISPFGLCQRGLCKAQLPLQRLSCGLLMLILHEGVFDFFDAGQQGCMVGLDSLLESRFAPINLGTQPPVIEEIAGHAAKNGPHEVGYQVIQAGCLIPDFSSDTQRGSRFANATPTR